MKSSSVKKLLVALAIVAVIAMVATSSFALDFDPSDYEGDTDSTAAQGIQDVSRQVIGIIQVIAMVAAVIVLIIIAIKYITAAPGEKAEIKKTALFYIIGVVLLFAGTAILELLQDASNEIGDAIATVSYIEKA